MMKIFKAYKTLKRIKELQKTMHDSSLIYLGLMDNGLIKEKEVGRAKAKMLHEISHLLEDVLEGQDPDKAIDNLL